jgi:hypothetical protein
VTYPAYDNKTRYTTGNIVSYNGSAYQARGVNFKDIVPTDARYWTYLSTTTTTTTTSTGGTTTSTNTACVNAGSWVQGQNYAAGSYVVYNGGKYYAKYANPGYNPTISTYYWAPATC